MASNETFQTAIDFDDGPYASTEASSIRLPASVNLITLRETLLSNAPFVTRANRNFWRKWFNTKQFSQILASSYYLVEGSITDNGGINVDILHAARDSSYIRALASNFSEMFFMNRLFDRDIFFSKLPEIMCYMIVCALQTAVPKFYRLYNSVKFREIILDWALELTGGIRPAYIRGGREWLFSEASETTIMVTNAAEASSLAKKCGLPVHMQGGLRTQYSIEHSPLLHMYMTFSSHHDTLPRLTKKRVLQNTKSVSVSKMDLGDFTQISGSTEDISTSTMNSPLSFSLNRPITPKSPALSESGHPISSSSSYKRNGGGDELEDTIDLVMAMKQRHNPRAIKITLSHPPSRPLMNLECHQSHVMGDGKIREKKVDYIDVGKKLKESKINRKKMMKQYNEDRHAMREEVYDMHNTLISNLKTLNSKRKEELEDLRRSRIFKKSQGLDLTAEMSLTSALETSSLASNTSKKE